MSVFVHFLLLDYVQEVIVFSSNALVAQSGSPTSKHIYPLQFSRIFANIYLHYVRRTLQRKCPVAKAVHELTCGSTWTRLL
jgi:hypothetical protein